MAKVQPVGRGYIYKIEGNQQYREYLDGTRELLDERKLGNYREIQFQAVAPLVQGRKIKLMLATPEKQWKYSLRLVGFRWWKFWKYHLWFQKTKDILAAKKKMMSDNLMDFEEIEMWFQASGIHFSWN